MRQYRLDDLILRSRQAADLESDPRFDGPEAKRIFSLKYGELYGMVEDSGSRYFVSEQTITATGAASYAIPADHLVTRDVEWVYDSANHRRRLRPLTEQARSRWIGTTGDARRWECDGQQLSLYPTPSTGTYKHRYVPQSPDLSTAADSAMIDVLTQDGEAFVVYCTAAAMQAKGEGDTSYNTQQYEAARERFMAWCLNRAILDAPLPYVDDGDSWDRGGSWNAASFRWNPP